MKTKAIITALLAMVLIAAGGNAETAAPEPVPVERTGPSFQQFYFGAHINEFDSILVRGRPTVGAHVKGEEQRSDFYISRTPVQIGDYTIPIRDAYFIFHEDRLMRIRIINTFTSYRDEAYRFFQDVLGALKEKYGDTESVQGIWTRYDGTYVWEEGDLAIELNFSSLEYTYKPLHDKLMAEFIGKSEIRAGDL